MIIRHVESLNDAAVPAILDIYQKSFPVHEQMLVSLFWRILQDPASNFHLVVLEETASEHAAPISPLGFALWARKPVRDAPGYLWYLAIAEEARGRGCGETLYRSVIDTVLRQGAPAVVFEIEDEAEMEAQMGAAAAAVAQKRLRWYQRMGAKQLEGVDYRCGTDWQEPVRMIPMIHSAETCTPEQALEWMRQAFEADETQLKVRGLLALN